jgi:hypothetical protein
MQNTPDAPYFVYLYVFTCEQCYYPYVETLIVPKAPKDEIDRQAAGWTCTNCESHQYTAGYQAAVYARWLSVKNGKCLVRASQYWQLVSKLISVLHSNTALPQ